jgi:hypothetical protein
METLKNMSILVILGAFLASLHFFAVIVVVILIGVYDIGTLQGADVPVTESQRLQRESWKPIGDAIMAGLEVSFKVLTFPLAMRQRPTGWQFAINSLFWGLVMSMIIRMWLSRKEKKRKHLTTNAR